MKKWTKSQLVTLSHTHPIIAFDGVCNLCDGFIQQMIIRDEKKLFRYITLQSETGKVILSASDHTRETVVLIYNGSIYTYSDVGLMSIKILGGRWKPLSYLSILPKGLRDLIYHFISSNRYNWFGKKSKCMVPSDEMKELFLENL